MLQRINHIKNVGRFYDVLIGGTPENDPSFQKFNLVYADNGTGKSTISTIMKSLWRNEADGLLEKRTIGAEDVSTVSVRIDGKIYTFHNKQWNNTPDIKMEIFDEDFVSQNVFSPSGVNLENRRELFNYVVLGEENVAKVVEVQKLDTYIKGELKEAMDAAENTLGIATGVFDMKILDKTKVLDKEDLAKTKKDVEEIDKIIRHSERISNEKLLAKLEEFEVIEYQESIKKDLGSLSHVAEYKAHIQQHNRWIQDGVKIINDTETYKCPFCFQDIRENSAISAYKEFFSAEYQNHRLDVTGKLTSAQQAYSDAILQNVETRIENNNERCAFWKQTG